MLQARSTRRISSHFEERCNEINVHPLPALDVRGDTAKLERILDNLLDNTLKYTPAGGQVAVCATGGDPVTLTLFNSGSSIPPQELSRIFERFYRLDRARSAPRVAAASVSRCASLPSCTAVRSTQSAPPRALRSASVFPPRATGPASAVRNPAPPRRRRSPADLRPARPQMERPADRGRLPQRRLGALHPLAFRGCVR